MARRPRLRGGKPVPERLIDAAELLIGKFGVEGVSLRQIGVAAGTVNNYAVQYHFVDIDGLVGAIFAKRMPVVNGRMRERLARDHAPPMPPAPGGGVRLTGLAGFAISWPRPSQNLPPMPCFAPPTRPPTSCADNSKAKRALSFHAFLRVV